ncbi:MAG: hypothetical protein ACUVTR_03345 [Dehalococcoidia bacterium]
MIGVLMAIGGLIIMILPMIFSAGVGALIPVMVLGAALEVFGLDYYVNHG